MKLGVFYNFFDGEELIEKSIQSIRSEVDFITVIFQETSNFGNKANPENLEMLKRLEENGSVNSYNLYEPNLNLSPSENEVNKRNFGLQVCKDNGCTHFLAMDVDEFYKKEEFKFAKDTIDEQGLIYTACQMITFFKKPTYKVIPEEDYFVPFIAKITDSFFEYNLDNFPILVDHARQLNIFKNRNLGSKFYVFPRKELQMYHMSYVRKDITSKIQNSSSKNAMENPEMYIKKYNTWKLGETGMHPVKPDLFEDVEVVDNFFEIEL